MRYGKWWIVSALLGLAACAGEPEAERVELGTEEQGRPQGRANWSAELQEQIDAGNTAYAEEDYERAAEIFREATDENPELGVAWFGLYMAESALGNQDAAQEALEKAEARSPGLARMHDAATDTTARVGLPPGHPTPGDMPPGHPPTGQGAQDSPGMTPVPEQDAGR